MNDQQLSQRVQEAQAGCQEAFGLLAEQFESTVFSIVLRKIRNRSEAREVTQDVFLQAMQKLAQLREPLRFAGWLRQIAVRMSLNYVTRKPASMVSHTENLQSRQSDPETPLSALLDDEEQIQVRNGLAQLRELDRETLMAFYFDGMSLQEMSHSFESPVGTIKRRLHTARHRLRDQLVEFHTV